jgi:hypothetical protein
MKKIKNRLSASQLFLEYRVHGSNLRTNRPIRVNLNVHNAGY